MILEALFAMLGLWLERTPGALKSICGAIGPVQVAESAAKWWWRAVGLSRAECFPELKKMDANGDLTYGQFP